MARNEAALPAPHENARLDDVKRKKAKEQNKNIIS